MRYKIYIHSIIVLCVPLLCSAYTLRNPLLRRSRRSSHPFIAGDTFRAIANHIVDETKRPFNPEDVQKGDIIFLKTDYVPHFFESLHNRIQNPYILITHNSALSPIFQKAHDYSGKGQTFEKYLDDPKIIVWFAQNIDIEHPKLKALPLGIANSYWPHGSINFFRRVMRSPINLEEKIPRVYVNFTILTNSKERESALHYSKTCSFCDVVNFKNFRLYLEEVKQYRFALSPPGNGTDCHRTWEALLMGSIPIIKHSLLDCLFEGLPVVFVHDWTEMTESFLEQEYQKIVEKTHYPERMFANYWIDMVMSYKNI